MMMKQQAMFKNMSNEPLANRLRPTTLTEYVGQRHLIGPGKILYQLINSDVVPSMVFWGPPGVGKTTLARIIANQTKAKFINFSAVTSGIKDIRAVMKQAQEVQDLGEKTIVFVDEIHRFNKAQQDAFLPYIEQGSIILIGATTENPSFEINSALLSRCKVFVLKALTTDDLFGLLHYALISPKGFKDQNVMIDDDLLYMIAGFSNGDARVALNTLEMAVLNGAIHDALNTIADPVPLQIRNAPTKLMKELNYGKGYQYAHDYDDKITNMQCLPDNIKDRRYYFPTNQGTEAKVIKRMEQIEYLRKHHKD